MLCIDDFFDHPSNRIHLTHYSSSFQMRNLMLQEFNVIYIQCHTASKWQDPLRTILGPLAPFGMKRATEKSQGEGNVSELGSWGQGGELGAVGVFITWGCCNKMPQIYYRNVFSRSSTDQKSPWRHQQGHAPSEGSRAGPFLAASSFWWLQVSLGLRLHHPISSSVFTWPSFLCLSVCPISVSNKDTLIGFRAHPNLV